jgi:hypothetical protein
MLRTQGFRGFGVPAFTQQAFELFAQIARMRGDGVCIATFDAHGLRALGSEAADGLVRLARAFADAFKLAFVVDSPECRQAHAGIGVGSHAIKNEWHAFDPLQCGQAQFGFRCIERDVLKQLLLILGAQQAHAIAQRRCFRMGA